MNRRLCVWFATIGMGMSGTLALGQAAPAAPAAIAGPATNPSDIKPRISPATKSNTTIGPAEKTEISTFISTDLQFLTSEDPLVQMKVVPILVGELPVQAGGQNGGFSLQYLDAFAAIVDQQVVAMLNTHPALRTRLYLGVLSAEVAQHTGVNQQSQSAMLLLQDSSEPIVIWGMKTAKFVLPQQLQVQVQSKENSLLKLIVETGAKYPGPVLEEAYNALTLEPLSIVLNPKNAAANKQSVVAVIPKIHDLISKRNASWANGLPKEPMIDGIGTNFLVNAGVWAIETPAQQKETLHLMSDLLTSAAAAYPSAPDPKDFLGFIVFKLSGGITTVLTGDVQVANANAVVRKLNTSSTPAQIVAACGDLVTAVQGDPLMAPAPGAAPAAQGPTSRATSGTSPAGTLAGIK